MSSVALCNGGKDLCSTSRIYWTKPCCSYSYAVFGHLVSRNVGLMYISVSNTKWITLPCARLIIIYLLLTAKLDWHLKRECWVVQLWSYIKTGSFCFSLNFMPVGLYLTRKEKLVTRHQKRRNHYIECVGKLAGFWCLWCTYTGVTSQMHTACSTVGAGDMP